MEREGKGGVKIIDEISNNEVEATVENVIEEQVKDEVKIDLEYVIVEGEDGFFRVKKIGSEARKDLEMLLNKSVYLELFVKTVKKWREKERYLSEFGFNDFEE